MQEKLGAAHLKGKLPAWHIETSPHCKSWCSCGIILVDGKLEPFWYEGYVLPQQLTDIAEGLLDISDEDSDSEKVYTPQDLDYSNEGSSESDKD